MESQAALGEESVGGIVLKGSESLGGKAEGKNNGNKHEKTKLRNGKSYPGDTVSFMHYTKTV